MHLLAKMPAGQVSALYYVFSDLHFRLS